jgi:hypothetical protein
VLFKPINVRITWKNTNVSKMVEIYKHKIILYHSWLLLIIFKDAVLTTEFSVLWNDMENDHENLEQVLMPCLNTLRAALTKMMRKGHEQTCLV